VTHDEELYNLIRLTITGVRLKRNDAISAMKFGTNGKVPNTIIGYNVLR